MTTSSAPLNRVEVASSVADFPTKRLFFSAIRVDAVTATGSTQADGAKLTAGTNVVSGANGTKAVVLPPAFADTIVRVINTVTNQDLIVFPESETPSGVINSLSANAAFTQTAGTDAIYVCTTRGQWYVRTASTTGTTTSASTAELNTLAGVTAGTSSPSKALVLDATESLNWATTDATAGETATLIITDTRTGAGATGWAAKFDLETNVALGSYANAVYGYLGIGASGKVTGLGAGVCAETVLSAGCVDGTYAGLEVEMGFPSGAKTGTDTSFLYLSAYGADASIFDTNGFFFHLVGVTKNTGKLLADATTGSTARPVQVLRVKTPDGTRYLPLYDTVAIAA